MLTSQLIFVTRYKDLEKVRSLNFKRFKLSVFLILFSFSFGLTQTIAKAEDNSPDSNASDSDIDLLDCNYDEQVRLFLDPLFCMKRGYKIKDKDKDKETKITKNKRAEEVSSLLEYFAKSTISAEELDTISYFKCDQESSTENSEQKCPRTGFSLSYRNLEEEDYEEKTITTFEPQDLCLWLLKGKCEKDLDKKLKSKQKEITDLEQKILKTIKTLVKSFRKSQCQLTSQAVTIDFKEHEVSIFCIKTRIRDNESISERAKRITQRIKNIQEENINLETLEIVRVSDLKKRFNISEYDNLTDSNQAENNDKNIDENESLALVSNQENLSQEDRIIFILTKLDLDLINIIDNESLNTIQVINDYFNKIIEVVKRSDKINQSQYEVCFNGGAFDKFTFLFERSKQRQEEQEKECQGSLLFEVEGKGKFFTASYRAATIENNINNLANEPWRIYSNPKLGVYYKQEKEQELIYGKLCKEVKTKDYKDYYELCDKEIINKEKKEFLNKNVVFLRNSNKYLYRYSYRHLSNKDSNLDIMTISNGNKHEPKEEEKYALDIILPTIKKIIHMYRYNQWLVLEIIFLSATSAAYFFHLDKKQIRSGK